MKIPCSMCGGTGELNRNAVRVLRERAGLEQRDLAGRLGITQSALSRLETGMVINWRHQSKLCEIFSVTRDQLAGEAPLDPKPARPKRAPPAGAIAKSRAHREALKKKNKAGSRK